jgi:hypothetical protein
MPEGKYGAQKLEWGGKVKPAEDSTEQGQAAATFEKLRERLLDLSKKNRMLNYNLGARSKRHLQVVDEVLEEIYRKLTDEEVSLRVEPLEEPEDIPPEEKTEEFIAAYEHAKVSNLEYSAANFSALSLELDPSKFYDREYGSVLSSMVDHVIKTESPIYEDLLVVRIARAHGFQRAGERIQKTLSGAIGKRYRKTQDDDRSVLWHDPHKAGGIVTYRSSQPEVRSHVDVPIAELASLAIPFLRLRLADEDVLYRMAERFELGRLREATRSRFQAAVHLAKQKLQSGVR